LFFSPPFGYFFSGAKVHNAAHYLKGAGYDFSETCLELAENLIDPLFFNPPDIPLDP
jgi:hypothetical protein